MADQPTHAYVATAPCGCTVGITIDNPDHRADVRKFVSEEMRRGSDITRVTIDEGRALAAKMFDCTHVEATASG